MAPRRVDPRIERARHGAGLVLLASALVMMPIGAAVAHEGEANVPAVTLVQEAIAIIRSQPDQMDAIADKINDALDSTQSTGVDLSLVRQAQQAFESGNLQQTELLLERSVGATPGQPVTSPNAGPRSPPASPPGPSSGINHLPALDRSSIGGVEGGVLVVAAALLMLGGALVLRRIG